jgi:hypothetical protein
MPIKEPGNCHLRDFALGAVNATIMKKLRPDWCLHAIVPGRPRDNCGLAAKALSQFGPLAEICDGGK